ncbi:MAG: acetylglutamate kinase [Tannerella sp.]|jgi:acetylglutamate kinase|nr:acetylglutamate kinase [Tannerella sp.]
MERLTIVKVGGKVVEDESSLMQFISDFERITGAKILVHGGGVLATRMQERLGIENRMVDGRRITDAETLKVVTMVYAGWVNKSIVAHLQALKVNAIGLTGADLNVIHSVKRPVKEIDYGYVGDIEDINAAVLAKLLADGAVPVMSPLTHDGKGNLLNTNADTIAAELAVALAQRFDVTLIYCFEKSGVLMDENDDESAIPLINKDLYLRYKAERLITGGMIPKLDNAFRAIDAGVRQVVITKASELGKTGGTRIVK